MEKDMIHDFYHNTRSEIKELEARIKNFDTDMQEAEVKHRTEIKVYMQKVKHLEYEHGGGCDRVKIEGQKVMKEERNYHTDKDKEMLKDKKKYKDDLNRDDQ